MGNFIRYKFKNLNVSVAVGDTAYAAVETFKQSGSNNPHAGAQNTKPLVLGRVVKTNHSTNKIWIDCDLDGGVGASTNNWIGSKVALMFQKNHKINTSGVIGYFAEVEFRNHSTLAAEIFATAVDYVESSK